MLNSIVNGRSLRLVASSMVAMSFSSAGARCDEAQLPAHERKGSFLLQTPNESSTAAKAASLLHVDRLAGGKNEEIGRQLIAQRDKQLGPNVSVFYKQDGGLVVTSGTGPYMRDIDGNLHLDCCNNVASVGHAHPNVVMAGAKELSRVQTNSRFLNPVQQRYLSKLLSTFPSELNTVYLVNSGSEANDLALRIARAHTTAARPKDVIVLDSAYHGHTQSLVDISPYKWYQAVDGKNYQAPTTHVAPSPDGFRGIHRLGQTEECGRLYAQEVEKILADGGVGTFIAESILGCGGQIVPPPGYLRRCYAAVRQAGGVCIADEVQTGFARTGTDFWMFQRHGVVPDIVTVGKPMGNGYPVAAVICRREVAESFARSGIEYFNTYGGNSVACAIAEAVFDTIQEENLQENALRTGEHLTRRLVALQRKYPAWVGDVRGVGLFQGIEFIRDREQTQGELLPYPELTKFLVDFLRYQRVIVSRDGPDENVIKVKPPLVFREEHVDLLVDALDLALAAAQQMDY